MKSVWAIFEEVLGKDIEKLKGSPNKVLLTLEIRESSVIVEEIWDGKHLINTTMGSFREDEIESITLVEKDGSLPQLTIKLKEFSY